MVGHYVYYAHKATLCTLSVQDRLIAADSPHTTGSQIIEQLYFNI